MLPTDDSAHFQKFAKDVEAAIAKYGHLPEEDHTELQRQQVEGLAALELQFRDALIKDRNGVKAYQAFINYVLNEEKNILAARPFFRERRPFFASDISGAIRNKDIAKLQKFHVNYHFVNLVTKSLKFGPKVKKVVKLIQEARQKLVTMNLPLVINRASIFWSRTHKSHLSFMDLVQIGTEGLISAVDKYCGEYSKVWRGVAIGRMVGNLIETYSSTMLHFYPADKRKIYRANKFRSKHLHGDYETEDMVKEVSKAAGNETTTEEIVDLMAASAIVSADAVQAHDDTDGELHSGNISRYAAPEEVQPDKLIESQEAHALMGKAIKKLSLLNRKLLRLKGLDIQLK